MSEATESPEILEPTLQQASRDWDTLLGIAFDALRISPPRYVSSIFGLPRTWLPPFSRYSEFKIVDLWRPGRTAKFLANTWIPSIPRTPPTFGPPLLNGLFWQPTVILQRPDHNGSYTDLPGRGLVLRQWHHDQRFGGADQLGLPGLPLPSAPDDDPELHRFAVDRPVRVRGGQRVVSGGRAGGQGAPADLRRAEEPSTNSASWSSATPRGRSSCRSSCGCWASFSAVPRPRWKPKPAHVPCSLKRRSMRRPSSSIRMRTRSTSTISTR